MKIGFIFAGQGQQFLNMGQDLVEVYPSAQKIYEKAHDILGYNLLTLSQEALQKTLYTQPALYVLNHALDTILKAHDIKPDVVAGLSLGEYNALLSAGVFSFEEGLRLIEKRAHLMQYALEENTTGMIACLKTDKETIEAMIKDTGLEICNLNTPSQVVIGGYKKDIDEVLPKLKEAKIFAVPLKVSTVSHMSLLKDASLELKGALKQLDFKKPSCAFINNLSAQYQEEGFIETLSKHIANPTHLSETISKMAQDGVTRFIEIGPKGSISKFVKEICGHEVIIQNVYDTQSLGGIL